MEVANGISNVTSVMGNTTSVSQYVNSAVGNITSVSQHVTPAAELQTPAGPAYDCELFRYIMEGVIALFIIIFGLVGNV